MHTSAYPDPSATCRHGFAPRLVVISLFSGMLLLTRALFTHTSTHPKTERPNGLQPLHTPVGYAGVGPTSQPEKAQTKVAAGPWGCNFRSGLLPGD